MDLSHSLSELLYSQYHSQGARGVSSQGAFCWQTLSFQDLSFLKLVFTRSLHELQALSSVLHSHFYQSGNLIPFVFPFYWAHFTDQQLYQNATYLLFILFSTGALM